MARDHTKPFSAAERARIVKTVRGHRQLGPLLKGRARVLMVEPHIAGRGAHDKALVAIYDYDSDRSLVALVHPTRARVLTVDEAPASFQLSSEERLEAEALARADKRVKTFLSRRPMNPLTRLYFPPHESGHRHAIVILRPSSSARSYAVVDLTDRRVADVLSLTEFAG